MTVKATTVEKLDKLAELGIGLREKYSIEDLHIPDDYKDGDLSYEDLLLFLGATRYNDQFEADPLSNHIWRFDTECIMNHGDYVKIVKRLMLLAQDQIAVSAVNDFVDVSDVKAWMSYTLNGKTKKVKFKVDNDWVDTKVFIEMAKVLDAANKDLKFTYYDLGGQECLIGCATEEQVKRIKDETGIEFLWLVTL